MCCRRSSSRRSRKSTPPSVTRPCCGSQKRSSRLATVDLPAPDAPTSATVLPGGTSKLTRSIAGTPRPGYVNDTASNRTAGSPGIACAPSVTVTGSFSSARKRRVDAIVSASWRATWPISATGMNAATATSTSSGNDSRGNPPRAHNHAPSAATASPPSPLATSSAALCVDRSSSSFARCRRYASTSATNAARRRPIAWNAVSSASPWIVSVRCAPSWPSASRAPVPSRSTSRRASTGASPAHSRNGSSTSASGHATDASNASTPAGTSTATNAGASVCA